MRRLHWTLLLVLVFTIPAFAGQVVPLDGAAHDRARLEARITAEDADGVHMHLELGAVELEQVQLEGGAFATLRWAEAGQEGAVGQPRLPVKRFFVEVPYGAEVRATVSGANWTDSSLQLLGAASRLAPVQPPLEKRPGATRSFALDEAAYSLDRDIAGPVVEVESVGILRGRRIATVVVRPVRYVPATGELSIATRLDLEVAFRGGNTALTRQQRARYTTSAYEAMMAELTVNPGTFATDELDELPAVPHLLIVSVDDSTWLGELEPFVQWKRRRGYQVSLVTLTETGTSREAIKAYVQNAYDTWEVPPSSLLLVGDTPAIWHWTGSGTGSPATDLNYGMLEGSDYFPDIGVSRFSVEELEDLQNIIAKTLNFEQATWTRDDNWIKNTSWIAGNDNYTITEGTHNYCINTWFDPNSFTSHRIYEVSEGATSADITTNFNDGRGLVTFSGHGSETTWADGPQFTQAQVNSLTNDVFPFVQSYACVTGKYERSGGECFGETFSRASSGALAFWGSSVNSYWDEDDILERRVFEGVFDNQDGDSTNFTWVNGATDYGKMKLFEYYGDSGTIRRYFEMYNVLGDGTVVLWTELPTDLDVTMPQTVLVGMNEVDVSVANLPEWGIVTSRSSSEPDVGDWSWLDASGGALLNLDPAPLVPGTLFVDITGYNARPFRADLPIVTADGPYVIADSFAVHDAAAWNPDGEADYGETVNLSLQICNVGVDEAVAPTVTLSCEGGWMSFPDGSETYPNIAADGGLALVEDAFSATVGGNVADGQTVDVTVTVEDASGSWESLFRVDVKAPDFQVLRTHYADNAGNGNAWPDPGETVDMTVVFTNEGSLAGYNPDVTLTSLDENITVDQATDACGTMAPGAVDSVTFTITTDPGTPQDYSADLQMNVGGDHSLDAPVPFAITVGDERYTPSDRDFYGYVAYDSNDDMPEGMDPVDYDWVEICADSGGPGTEIPMTMDDEVAWVNLPFEFTYYGETYAGFAVSADGWIAFGGDNAIPDASNSTIPHSDGPAAMVAVYWDDLDPSQGNSGGLWKWYDSANDRFVLQWNQFERGDYPGQFETFQLILENPQQQATESGDGYVLTQYKSLSDSALSAGTIGVESHDELDGQLYVHNGAYDQRATLLDEAPLAVLFAATGWDPFIGPTDLEAELTHESGVVDLSWVYDEERWNRPDMVGGGSTSAEKDFMMYIVYRFGPDEELHGIGTSEEKHYSDSLEAYGEYNYTITAYHDDLGETPYGDTTTVVFSENSVDPARLSGLPESFGISRTWPNPFNPTLQLTVALPAAGRTSVEVYDLLGRRVATLADRVLEAGYHTLAWSPRTAAGVYFVRARAADGTQAVRKVIFMK